MKTISLENLKGLNGLQATVRCDPGNPMVVIIDKPSGPVTIPLYPVDFDYDNLSAEALIERNGCRQ